jgi:hypothetical protein
MSVSFLNARACACMVLRCVNVEWKIEVPKQDVYFLDGMEHTQSLRDLL